MKEYHKIETLWKFNSETHKYHHGEFYNRNVEILQNNLWTFTEKIDGTNFRIIWDGHKLTYGGRTNKAIFSKEQIQFIEERLINEYIETTFEQIFKEKEVYVFGELYGNGIQKGGGLYTNGNGLSFKVFDIMIDEIFLTFDNAKELSSGLGYDFVPFVMVGNIQQGIDYVLQNEKSTFSNAKLEGLVGKPVGDFKDRLGKRIVAKIKRRDLENIE